MKMGCGKASAGLVKSAAVFLLAAGAPGGVIPANAGMTDRIIAIVNDDVITQAELESRLNDVLKTQPGAPEGAAAQVQQVVLLRLIEQRLILQEGKRLDVKVTEEEIAARLKSLKDQIGPEEAFEQWMKDEHLSMAEIKKSIQDQLLAQHTVDAKVRSAITVSPQEVAEALKDEEVAQAPDQVFAQHILVRINDSRSEEEARIRVNEILGRLSTGQSFEELAKIYSDDPQAENGGKMGWVEPGQLLPDLDAALFALQPGEISPPVQTGLGLHLLRAGERKSGARLSEIEANHAAFKKIYEHKFKQGLEVWLGELKKKAYIEYPKE